MSCYHVLTKHYMCYYISSLFWNEMSYNSQEIKEKIYFLKSSGKWDYPK